MRPIFEPKSEMHEKSENEISDLLFLKKQKPGESALTDFPGFLIFICCTRFYRLAYISA